MNNEFRLIMAGAATIACLHTAAGPDHYIPFIALSKTRGWTLAKTIAWTLVCGCAHVWSSVLLGSGGAALGWGIKKMGWLEGIRGGVAAWALLLFGFFYMVWGIIRGLKNRLHKHFDMQNDGNIYVYEHKHGQAVIPAERHKLTPWVMFIIFFLGPCEPMIPLLFVPAVRDSLNGMIMLISVYTLITLTTMLLIVVAGYYGLSFLKSGIAERYIHAIGGFTLLLCGTGMVFMGW
jgi:hypothetical protein